MTDFINFLTWKLSGAVRLALAAAVTCGLVMLGIWLLRRWRYGREYTWPWRRCLLGMLFCAYLAALLYATLLRNDLGFVQINFHLFRAWREAWNSFSVKNWLNVLLNVALFLPLGVLLPLLSGWFRKWDRTVLLGFLLSLIIEGVQYALALGLADVDDLFCNTLGTILGYCLLLGILALRRQDKRRSAWYLAVPALFCGALGIMSLVYTLQPYGNLMLAPSYRVNTEGIHWEIQWNPEEQQRSAVVYQADGLDQKTADAFAREFFHRIGAEVQSSSYYGDSAYYGCHVSPGHFLFVDYLDGSFTYSNMDAGNLPWSEHPEASVRTALTAYEIVVPEHAVFSYEGDGWHCFSQKQVIWEGNLYDGQLRCRLNEAGQIGELEQFLHAYRPAETSRILTEREALLKLKSGWFQEPYGLQELETVQMQVLRSELEYRIDSKGYYQPVYVFDVWMNGEPLPGGLLVPALGRP